MFVAQRALDGDVLVAEGLVGQQARQWREFDLAASRCAGFCFAVTQDLPGDFLAVGIQHGGQARFDALAEQLGNVFNGAVGNFLALGAEALAHLLPEARCIDQLHQAPALGRLTVGQHPHVGADAGVVEHIGGQADDRLDQIVLQQVAANL
ncbi:hypothetical protein D9M70_473940 [compost metagenome]